MDNIIKNFMVSIISNPITVIFLALILLYSIIKIVENKNLYDYINQKVQEINEHQRRSIFFRKILNKYNMYQLENPYADVNTNSLIEEVISDLHHKNKYILDKIRALKNASSICILLGVLGTFVGLSTMLLTVNTNDIINSLPNTISSMQTAFTTSIFGILSSLILNFCIRFKDCENSLLQLMLKSENLLTAEITNINKKSLSDEVNEIKDTVTLISKSISALENFDKISNELNEFSEGFASGIESLKLLLENSISSIKTFDENINKLDKQFNILNIKFEGIFDKYDKQDDINKEILIEMKECTKNIYNSSDNNTEIKTYIQNISSEFILYKEDIKSLLDEFLSYEEILNKSNTNTLDSKIELDNSIKNLSNIIAMMSKDIQDKFDIFSHYIKIYSNAVDLNESTVQQVETINTKPDEKFVSEEIYEIDNEQELNNYNKSKFTLIKNISEEDFDD